MLNPRLRIVTLRLLEQEYAELENLCVQENARCLSDLARAALRRLTEREDSKGLHARIEAVRAALQKLHLELEKANGGAAKTPVVKPWPLDTEREWPKQSQAASGIRRATVTIKH